MVFHDFPLNFVDLELGTFFNNLVTSVAMETLLAKPHVLLATALKVNKGGTVKCYSQLCHHQTTPKSCNNSNFNSSIFLKS